VDALNRLADVVVEAVEDIPFKRRTQAAAWSQATDRLAGDDLDRLVAGVIHPNTLKRKLRDLEKAYGLDGLNFRTEHRPARALVLLAAEREFAPLAEGLIGATEWWPSSTRLDLRAVFHLLTRWWTQTEPRILSRLAVSALRTHDDEFLPWRPLTALYRGVLTHHRAADRRSQEADELSRASIRLLYAAYRNVSTKREIMQDLFGVAEGLHVIERRPSFDVAPEMRRKLELIRVALDLELGRPVDDDDLRVSELLHGRGA